MSHAAPTFNQIKAQVAAIRKSIPNARTVAIRASGRWTGNSTQTDGDETFSIFQCDSPLAMRIALRANIEDGVKVLVTSLEDQEVGDDILLRLKPRRLVPLDSWQIIKSLFQARTIDPRLTRQGWIAETLMDLIPPEGFSPVASGFLDAETVWPILLGRLIGLEAETPDLLGILKWSTSKEDVARFRNASAVFRDSAMEWLAGLAGPTAATVLGCVIREEQPDAVPIGLAAGVVFHQDAAGRLEKASGKLEERYLGGASPKSDVFPPWNAAATDVVRVGLSDARLRQQLLGRADEILREVGAEAFASLSDTSPHGFDLRLSEFGKRLGEVLSSKTTRPTEELTKARDSVFRHDRCGKERRRMDRVDMAMRLVRWLGTLGSHVEPSSLAEAANHHLQEDGFVDWARLTLRSGDPIRDLSEGYAKLFDRVTAARELRSKKFAELLRDWSASGTSASSFIPVEQVLDRVVSPLAAQTPVLVIVIDGLSVAVFRELMSDILGQEWIMLAEEGVGIRPGLATVPSVTEVSRTSLLCGRLIQGSSSDEKPGFAGHAGLLEQSRTGYPPVLFHKASLQESEDASLAADIRKEIGSTHRKIVGVVVNAVDDHLLKGEQIDTRWTRDEIKVLPVLLHEAKMANRTVIILSDHGHVLECNTKFDKHDGGERWRVDEGSPGDNELRIGGPRVLIPESGKLLAPWSEKIRYGMKKNGYHGGLSPQEMVVPIAVLSANKLVPDGMCEAPVDIPGWWDDQESVDGTSMPVTVRQKPKPAIVAPTLFDMEPEVVGPATTKGDAAGEPVLAEWISALIASPIYESQKKLGGRAALENDVFVKLLTAIDNRGGKITSVALAKAIQCPAGRLRGFLAIAIRVLNVDGYQVLTRDDASDTVELNRQLLCRQFDLV